MEDPTHLLVKEGEGSKNDLGFFLSFFVGTYSVCVIVVLSVYVEGRDQPSGWLLLRSHFPGSCFFFKKIRFYVFYLLCICVFIMSMYVMCGWRAACGSRLSYHLGPGNLTQAAGPGSR